MSFSFRNRLAFFFVVIVIVPVIAVSLVLFTLISDNENGKADAAVAANEQSAISLYGQASSQAMARLQVVATDRILDRDLLLGRDVTAARRAIQILPVDHVIRIVVARAGTTVVDAGDPAAVAPATGNIVAPSGQLLGRLQVAVLSAAQYAALVERVTGLGVVVHQGSRVIATTLPAARSAEIAGHGPSPARMSFGGQRYRLVSFVGVDGFPGTTTTISVLGDVTHSTASLTKSRLQAIGLIVAFFLLALASALLVSRSLQAQIASFLQAARRLGTGDFSSPVPISGGDEFAALGEEFNRMSRELERRLEELRQEQARLQASLQRIGETFASNLDRRALLDIILRTAVDGVGAQVGRVTVRNGDGGFVRDAQVGEADQSTEAALEQAESRARVQGAGAAVDGGPANVIAHPVAPAGEVLAVISVARQGAPFAEGERDLLRYLAGQASVSLENVDLHERVQRQAVTDDLTGLYNHGRFQEAITAELERARRFGQPLGLVMLDIDNFKRVNDTYGHQQGDLVLREVARIVRENSREIDSPARYGGEELAVVLPGTNLDGAVLMAERIREGIAALRVRRLDGEGEIQITASLGVSAAPQADTAPSLIAAADLALYEAKRTGKNKTVRAR
ncbi:MAG TPA: diguanylate cyclase [Solirubrobacteraceae bacterium]|jgi:diguanylate cyclase (GGDEF)-like protein|nr:diguanylate cyclase [Solirubrobacteraceae bacterium]